MNCHFCHQKIKGKGNKVSITTCHPAITYYEATVCNECYKK